MTTQQSSKPLLRSRGPRQSQYRLAALTLLGVVSCGVSEHAHSLQPLDSSGDFGPSGGALPVGSAGTPPVSNGGSTLSGGSPSFGGSTSFGGSPSFGGAAGLPAAGGTPNGGGAPNVGSAGTASSAA